MKEAFNVFRNGTPLLRKPVDEETARAQFESIKNIFVSNRIEICAQKDSFTLFGFEYRIGIDNRQ